MILRPPPLLFLLFLFLLYSSSTSPPAPSFPSSSFFFSFLSLGLVSIYSFGTAARSSFSARLLPTPLVGETTALIHASPPRHHTNMPSLTSMAEAILVRARCIDAYLEAERIAYPSFDEDTLRQLPNELQDERWALANLVNEMKQLTRGAEMRPFDVAFNVRQPSNVMSRSQPDESHRLTSLPVDG